MNVKTSHGLKNNVGDMAIVQTTSYRLNVIPMNIPKELWEEMHSGS